MALLRHAILVAAALAAAACDPGFPSGRYACVPGDPSTCPSGMSCQLRLSQASEPRCYAGAGAYCGDGAINDSNESCDGIFPSGMSCQTLGYYDGSLACDDHCRIVATDCYGYCGDGIVDDIAEECDGFDQRGATCLDDASFTHGVLGCDPTCHRDTSGCRGAWVTTEFNANATAIWSDGSDAWYASSYGSVAHLDGGAWSSMPLTNVPLNAVWGTAPNDVFVVGQDGSCFHFDGATWSPQDTGTSAALNGIAGTASNNLFAVGDVDILHYDGSAWSPMANPTNQPLYGVWAAAPDAVFAVGEQVILRYDGTAWSTIESSGSLQTLRAVWGSARDDVWAVGDAGTILRWQGSSFAPIPAVTIADLRAISGVDANDVYAVGDTGVVHWDGTIWQGVPDAPASSLTPLRGVSATAQLGITLVGAIVARREDWSVATMSAPIDDVWAASPTDAYAASNVLGLLHGDGIGWTPMREAVAGWGRPGATCISGVAGDVVYAGSQLGPPLRYDGTQWSTTSPVTPVPIADVWAASPDEAFGIAGTEPIEHWAHAQWVGMPWDGMGAAATALLAIWGSSPSDVFAVGESGTVVHYDGSSWSRMSSGATVALSDVWGTSHGNVFAVGAAGTILHFDGTRWTPMPSGTSDDLAGVSGNSAFDVYAVGPKVALRYDGARWSPVRLPAEAKGTSVAITGDGASGAFLADEDVLARRDATAPATPRVYCGATTPLFGDTTRLPPTEAIPTFPCATRPDPGPTALYYLTSPIDGTVTVTLQASTGDLDLFVEKPCQSAITAGTNQRTLVFPVRAGATYRIMVATPAAPSGYTLSLQCSRQ